MIISTEEHNKSVEQTSPILKNIYSWVMPETEAMIAELAGEEEQEALKDLHRRAWSKTQDRFHMQFYLKWKDWTEGVIDHMRCANFYPTAGSSEGIRESLAQLASLAHYRPHLGVPTIHTIKGDYEGYKALARPYGIRVVEHEEVVGGILQMMDREGTDLEGHRLYISCPSSINGNLMPNLGHVLDFINDSTAMKVMLDLCYVGCVPSGAYRVDKIPANHDAVDTVFFSLSKAFGVYYHRIGGMISKTKHPGLWGNRWFKNLTSLNLGMKLMNRYGVSELPDKYRPLQKEAIREISMDRGLYPRGKYGDGTVVNFSDVRGGRVGDCWMPDDLHREIKPSDVFIMAYQRTSDLRQDVPFQRSQHAARYCLTKLMFEKAMEQGLYNQGSK